MFSLLQLVDKMKRFTLITRVNCWSCMGGTYPKGSEANLQDWRGYAKNAIEKWPTPIIFSGNEIGCKYPTGNCLNKTPKSNPVRRIYE